MRKILLLLTATLVISCEIGISKTAYVLDGDTIDVHGERIRFARIDAYEVDTPLGRDAKRFLTQYIKDKKIIYVRKGIGKYKRTIAEVYADGVNINDLMVQEGLAIYKNYNN